MRSFRLEIKLLQPGREIYFSYENIVKCIHCVHHKQFRWHPLPSVSRVSQTSTTLLFSRRRGHMLRWKTTSYALPAYLHRHFTPNLHRLFIL